MSAHLEISADSPIGVFDSGVGGLSVLQAIASALPCEQLIYVADTAYAPYGERSDAEIIERSIQITRWLVEQGCKAVVVACNTATAAAIATLRETFDLAIIGVEPGLKPAVEQSKTGRVGVLATSYTVRSAKFCRLVDTFAQDVQLTISACPGLVETLEKPGEHAQHLQQLLVRYLEPMREQQIDMLVLGCTHYSFLKTAITDYLGPDVSILDTPGAIAREVQRQLIRRSQLTSRSEHLSQHRYLSSAQNLEPVEQIMRSLTGLEITLEQLRR